HRFAGPVEAVVALLADPAFHRSLQLPDVELLSLDDRDGHLRCRYRFVGSLDPIARRLLAGRDLTWQQDLRVDPSGTGSLSFRADADPRKLHGSASFAIEPKDGGSRRRLDGQLVVAVPLIGGRAERSIVPGLLRRLDI